MSGCEDCPIPQSLSHAAPITEEGSAVRMVLTNDLGLRMRDLSVLCLTTSRNTLPGGAGERNKPDSLPPAMTMSMACNKPRYPHAHCRRLGHRTQTSIGTSRGLLPSHGFPMAPFDARRPVRNGQRFETAAQKEKIN